MAVKPIHFAASTHAGTHETQHSATRCCRAGLDVYRRLDVDVADSGYLRASRAP